MEYPSCLRIQDIDSIADEIIRRHMMPTNARLDALHVATAALAGVQYLSTQNCTHIASATELSRIYKLLNELGLSGMLVCAPIEFFLGGLVVPNTVLDELHAVQRKILSDWNGDTSAYLKDAQARLEKSGRPIWQGKQRTKQCTEVAEQPVLDGGSTPATR